MKIITIIGARPQFVKASVVSHALRNTGITEILVNTGQHYDDNMAKVFFEEMGIPRPDYDLGVGSGTHARQTSESLVGIEDIILKEQPDGLIVYGDTNATIAGALAASKLHVKLIHIEAGLRSYNRKMPEEINRVVTDVLSDLLFVPTEVAVKNLAKEGITAGVHIVGDVMVDALIKYTQVAEHQLDTLEDLGLASEQFNLMTIHRPSNTDDDQRLQSILEQVSKSDRPVIFPVHPRGRKRVNALMEKMSDRIRIIDPVGYLDMMLLEKHARFVITDSGGVQKEAYLHKTKCLTVRAETEWVETVRDGWNQLVGDDLAQIPVLLSAYPEPDNWSEHYGDGHSASRIVDIIINTLD
ncbi:MAG: UDP-N-acetylglucosamine 2-epimerase (non-hydrolyzing) [Candidatus Marinimicrobia bacterium]|nr:UDP-N-acetylglucosamine 2-epimerase (non-hydrolyzing) [Candidatus Neomarinimicrobiota bacterium]MCF7905348.1 UDP-N-acetylglucosamine 2-epimerase (non-hydrolyzing) [Candidatus Neomarinimicrobiota bacterium]